MECTLPRGTTLYNGPTHRCVWYHRILPHHCTSVYYTGTTTNKFLHVRREKYCLVEEYVLHFYILELTAFVTIPCPWGDYQIWLLKLKTFFHGIFIITPNKMAINDCVLVSFRYHGGCLEEPM